jgi:hypothetical protein
MSHDQLINRLFKDDASRAIARDSVARFADQPFVSDRIPVFLQEAAAANDRVASGALTADQAREQLSGFAALGAPAGVMESLTAWYDGAEDAAAGTEETPGGEPAQGPEAPQAPTQSASPATPASSPLADRAALQRRIAEHEKNMRSPEGSDQWKSYWKNESAQAEFRAAHEALQASTDALSKLGSVASPAPSQPAPAATAPPTPAAPSQ